MTTGQDVRHGLRIGRAEFVRSVRAYLGNNRRILGFLVFLLFVGGNLLFSLPVVFLLGRQVQSASAIPFLEPIGTALPVVFLLFAALRTVERISGIEAEALLLTTVHPRALIVGLLTAELSRLLLWFGAPILGVAGVFAAGLGAPILVVTAGIVLLPLICCAAVWGYALGLGVLRLLRGLPTIRRLLKGAAMVGFIVLIIGSQLIGGYLATAGTPLEEILSAISVAPLSEYVALAFLGTPLSQSVHPSGLAVLAGWLCLTPVGFLVAERQATALWFTDAPVKESDQSASTSGESSAVSQFSPPKPFVWTTAGHVAWGILVRAVRKPQELVHLITILFFAGPLLGTVVQGSGGDAMWLFVAAAGVVLGVYLSGATFGLNPLGDDRPQFPFLLLTETSPQTYLHGRMGAGLVVGIPVALLAPLVALTVSGSPMYGIAFAASGVVWCLLAALFAVGLGCLYPIYEEREIWGTETVSPSMLVVMAYSFVVMGGTGSGLFALWFTLGGNLSLTAVAITVLGVYLLLTLGLPVFSYGYAVRRYRRYVLD